MSSTTTRRGILSASIVSFFLLILFSASTTLFTTPVSAAVTVPTCRLNRQVYAGDLRTTDNRGVLISVIGDWVNFNNQPDARAIELMNGNGNVSNTEAAYDPTKKLIVESIFLLNDTIEGSLIGINFKQLPDYWLGGRNDTVTIHLPSNFFWSGIPCTTFSFKILPSAGSLDVTAIPVASFSEINVNSQNQKVRIYINHDRFVQAQAWFVNPPNFTITQEIDTTISALNCIEFTIHRNQTYNPPVGHTDRITIIFNNNMTGSGVAPIIGDGVSIGSVSIDITGVEPIASVTYQNPSLGAMRSEDLWDGNAWALLVLEGDTFSPNATLWELPDVQPVYEAAKPVRPYGFEWFLNLGMRPNYTISSRSVNISFPPLEGFTIPEIVDQMKMSEVGRVTNEKRSIDPVPFRVLRCDDSSPFITFSGTPWRNNSDGSTGISEVDVRRYGINITLTIKYNVWTNTLRVREMISSLSFGASTLLRYTDNVGSITDRLRFDLFVPPQTTYDISVPEMMAVTAFSTMTETRQPMTVTNRTFNISQFEGASTCFFSTNPEYILESDIRNTTGQQLNVTYNIVTGTDEFCFSPQADLDLRQSMTITTGPGNPGPNLVPYIDFIWNSTKNITMRINKWPEFEITSTVYLAVTLPASIMCSIEVCRSEQGGGTSSSRIQMPIGATSGQLIGTMPRVSEAYMRTQTVSTIIDFLGDAFSLGTVGSTRGDIPLLVTVDPIDNQGRGFLASFPASVRKITIDNNMTRGAFNLAPNKSYDIVKEETISFSIVSVRAASQLAPKSLIVPLIIYPLLGELAVVYPNLTALALAQTTTIAAPTTTTGSTLGPNATADPNATTSTSTTTTSTTTTAEPTTTVTGLTTGNYSNTTTTTPGPTFEPWVLNVVESEILNGNVTLNFTLANDRFNTAILPSVVRAQLTRHTVEQPSGIDSNKNIILADTAFYFDRDEFFMSIQFQKAPSYDITVPESFSLYINGSVLISEASPLQNTITINVQPDPGKLVMTGDALYVSSFDIVNGDRGYSITLDGDKFVSNVETLFNYTELCIVTLGGCQIKLDASRRNITVTYDPYRDFFIARNQNYTIVLHPWYFDSNVVPTGNTNVTVYLSGGKLEWYMTLVSVSEDAVRSGSYPDLAADKPIAKASISGDKFASKEDVRRALADSVKCVSADPNLAGTIDPYGFCARAKNLFGSIFFKVTNEERIVDVVLQPDDAFDIYAEETVTFIIGYGATQSRKEPIVAGKAGILSIYPTQGKFFISTSFVYITEQDISSPALASKLKLSISLYGERWLANTTRAVELLTASMISNVGTKEINGFTRYRTSIFPAKTAGTIDASGRLLELQFVAAAKYDVFNPETITIGVPAAAVLSPYAPNLQSVQSGFTIDTVGGILTGQALQTREEIIPGATADEDLTILVTNVITPTVSVMQTFGFNITLQLSRDTWDEVNLYSDWSLVYNAFSSSKTPQEEGHGFAVYKEEILKPKDILSPVPGNGTHRFFLLNPVANYDLVNPERLRIDLALFWTQQGNGGKATTPSYFEILIMPEFPFVEASVKSYEDLTDTTNAAAQAYIENWKNQVADKLAIIPSRIEIISIDKEWMVPDAAPYYRIRFKVTDITDPDIPYDNSITRLFTSWDRPFLESNFNVSFAFFNASPPEVKLWRTVEGGGGILDDSEAVGLSLTNIVYFIVGIILAIIVVFLIRRYQQGRHKNGLNWGESDGRKKADARFADSHDKEEENFDKAAELLFAGQRELVPYLADDAAAKAAKEDAARAAHAAKHGIVRQQTATQVLGDPSAKGYRLRTARPTTDGRDELAFFDIDENIYSGQKAIHKRATDADVGMPLIDRMVTSGTDHSTRISKTGASRLANLTDLMSPHEVEMHSPRSRAGQFVSPTDVKTRDPVLFGSERRINDLLEKVGGGAAGGGASSGYMTDLRSRLLDTGMSADAHKAIYNDNAANEQKLWSDKKADDIMMPPHLVGKVQRFRPPSGKK